MTSLTIDDLQFEVHRSPRRKAVRSAGEARPRPLHDAADRG